MTATVAYETGADLDRANARAFYQLGWNDAAEALRKFAAEHDCLNGKPELRLILGIIAKHLKPGPDKSKMI